MAIDVVARVPAVTTDSAAEAVTSVAPAQAPNAVSTELPAAQSVQAASRSLSLPVDDAQQARTALQNSGAAQYVQSKFVYDEKNELVFVSIDELTGRVIDKFPDDAVLRDSLYQQVSQSQPEYHAVEKVA